MEKKGSNKRLKNKELQQKRKKVPTKDKKGSNKREKRFQKKNEITLDI
jgi:hypothetical protein